MMMINCVETLAKLMCQLISFHSFKKEIIDKLFTYKSHMNIHLIVFKRMINSN